MDSQHCILYLQTLIVFTFPIALETQRITCPNSCELGYTCAIVPDGSAQPTPGCITMQEAISLHLNLNGGTSVPGTVIGAQLGQNRNGVQQPNVMPNVPQPTQLGNAIPGMNALGNTVPELQRFDQRFEQGLSRSPITNFVNPQSTRSLSDILGIQGVGGSATGQFAAFGSPQGPPGLAHSRLLDQTAGQLSGRTGADIGSQGVGFGPQVDVGHNHSPMQASGRPGSLSLSNNIANTNGTQQDIPGGARPGRPQNDGFPGEQRSPELSVGPQSNTDIRNANLNTVTQAPAQIASQSQVTVNGTNNVTLTFRPERVGQVTRIMEDSFGLYYLFYSRPQSAGLRVNVTKNGFCRRDARTRERNICMNTCYSDRQCPRDLKCCPSGCSLGCITQSVPNQENNALPQVNSPRLTDTAQDVESRCISCQSHLDCNSPDQFCTLSDLCGQRIVCRLLIRR